MRSTNDKLKKFNGRTNKNKGKKDENSIIFNKFSIDSE